MSVLFTPDLETARQAFADFLSPITPISKLVAMHDSDADGVTAGVLWQRGLERMGFSNLQRLIPDRERNAWLPNNRSIAIAARPDFFFVLDLGAQPVRVVEDVPHCFIDHHHPEGSPPLDTNISSYSWNPIPNTSLLMWELLQPLVDIAELDWIAVIGAVSDLGDKAPFALIETAKKKYTAKYLKEATALVNAARRASTYQPEIAAQALLQHADPKELVLSNTDNVRQLKLAREEVKAAMNEAKKAAPVFSSTHPVALIRMNTPCQVHPLMAQIWRGRLPKYIVFAANEGYMPGRVNFSARAGSQYNIIDFLRQIKLSPGEGNFGYGHDQASGGSLPVLRWNELLEKLGFESAVFAPS